MKTLMVLSLIFSLMAVPGYAFRNECKNCTFVADPDDLICRNCGKYLNECLICHQPNPVKNDSCEICCNPLVESRMLAGIPSAVRESYKLGQSPRAILDRENSQIMCYLERTPDQEAQLLYQLGMNFQRMKFFAREAEAWGNFLNKFPTHPEARTARIYRSAAFVNWGYLFFREQNLAEAREKFQAAIADNPKNVEALVWLGRTNLAMGKVQPARSSLRAALAIAPGDPRARYLLKADPRRFRNASPEEAEFSTADSMGELYETAQWFPDNSVSQLK